MLPRYSPPAPAGPRLVSSGTLREHGRAAFEPRVLVHNRQPLEIGRPFSSALGFKSLGCGRQQLRGPALMPRIALGDSLLDSLVHLPREIDLQPGDIYR